MGETRVMRNSIIFPYSLSNIDMRWTGHVAHTGRVRNILKYVLREHQESREIRADNRRVRVTLESTSNKGGARTSIGLLWLGIRLSDGAS
jgi:hypothetical protein